MPPQLFGSGAVCFMLTLAATGVRRCCSDSFIGFRGCGHFLVVG